MYPYSASLQHKKAGHVKIQVPKLNSNRSQYTPFPNTDLIITPSPSLPTRVPRRPQTMRIPLDKLQLRSHVPLPLRPILLRVPAISLRILHLDPFSSVPKMLQFDHRTAIGTEAWGWSWRSIVRAVGAVRREGESICAAVGRSRRVEVAGVD